MPAPGAVVDVLTPYEPDRTETVHVSGLPRPLPSPSFALYKTHTFLHQDFSFTLICRLCHYVTLVFNTTFISCIDFCLLLSKLLCKAVVRCVNQCYCLIYSAVSVSGGLLHFTYPVWPHCQQSTAEFTLQVQTQLARCNHYSCHLHS